jgi:hypothetical protein
VWLLIFLQPLLLLLLLSWMRYAVDSASTS